MASRHRRVLGLPASTLDATTLSPVVSVFQPDGVTPVASYAYFGGSVVALGRTAFVVKTYTVGEAGALTPSNEVGYSIIVP